MKVETGEIVEFDQLDVWVDDHRGLRHVGILHRTREAGAAFQSSVTFAYDFDLEGQDAISLIMPVSRMLYRMPVAGLVHILLPIFDQNLPEGALRSHLQTRFAKIVPEMGDFELLGLLGNSRIGRVRVVRNGVDPRSDMKRERIDPGVLLTAKDSTPLMSALIEQMAPDSGVSGVQPKVLALSRVIDTDPRPERLTVPDDELIVKASGDDYPWLAANEYLCMQAARECGLRVPKIRLSEDQQLLLVKRFDFDANGRPIGFEDMASLTGRLSHQRYEGSYEEIAQTIRTMVSPKYLKEAQQSFFTAMVLNCGLENGDAHLKNFGLIYTDPASSVAFAPSYDIVCTTAYISEDLMALELNGSKNFPSNKVLERFGTTACGLNKDQVRLILIKVFRALDDMSIDIANSSNAYPDFSRQCGRPMLASLTRGMRRTLDLGDDYLPSGAHLLL